MPDEHLKIDFLFQQQGERWMELDPNRTVNISVQVLPLVEDAYPIVDRAIEAIHSSGVKYEVGAMETVMEGPLDDLLAIAKEAHLACFQAGAEKVVTFIKIGDHVSGTSIESKVGKYRQTSLDEGNHAS
jgi:uncharacterized protein (TIGR00106 family)